VHVPDLAHVPERVAHHRQRVRLRARHVHQREAAAEDSSSIRRLKKAR
jgi:hypothetical protein